MTEQDVREYGSPKKTKTAILQQLDGKDIQLLEEIDFLSRQQAKKSPTGAKYCTPSEAYLARKVHLSRANVSRHISKLSFLGILDVTHRKPIRDRFRTNLYKIRSWIAWRFMSLLARMRPRKKSLLPLCPPGFHSTLEPPPSPSHRVSLPTHISIPMRENIASSKPLSSNTSINNLLERWRSRATE